MLKSILLSFLLIFAAEATTPPAPESTSQTRVYPLTGATNFLVRYTIEDKSLMTPLKEEMIRSLQKIGKVFPGDDTKLSEQQKANKYETGQPIIELSIFSIVEENLEAPPTYKKLPVIAFEMKVLSAVEVINNKDKIPCSIWEKQMYISDADSKEKLSQTAVKHLQNLLNQFIDAYQQANPQKDLAPQFFLYL